MSNNQNTAQLDLEYLKTIRPHFEILCYGGKVYDKYLQSMIRWTSIASVYQVKWSFNVISNESLVTRARNLAAANFLTLEHQPTHLIFIDVDQGFNAEEILVLLNHKKDIITAPVPLKTIPLTYNINPLENEVVDPKTGLLKLARAGTGCMIIAREVLEKLKSHPDIYQYENDIKFNNDAGKIAPEHLYTYFNTTVVKDEQGRNRFMSEDYDFCEKWKDLGGEIWCDTRLTLSHIGVYEYGAQSIAFTEKSIEERKKQLQMINNNVEKGELQNENK